MSLTINLLNPMWNAWGGSERRTFEYFRELSHSADVRVWSEYQPDPELLKLLPIEQITTTHYPREGLLVIVGCYFKVGAWLRTANPHRVAIIVNTPEIQGIHDFFYGLSQLGINRALLVYAARWLREKVGLPGLIDYSPINLTHFKCDNDRRNDDHFVIGRLSRDVPEKHHPHDIVLYEDLARLNIQVRLMGGSALFKSAIVPAGPHIELIPVGQETAEIFLHSLDCFYYRTDPAWTEPYGRVVVEAMACGLPVVCEDRGGYTEFIESGSNGFLFKTDHEAREILMYLKHSPHARHAMGKKARQTAESLQNTHMTFISELLKSTAESSNKHADFRP